MPSLLRSIPLILVLACAPGAWAADPPGADGLPAYFSEALKLGDQPLRRLPGKQKDGAGQAKFVSADGTVGVSVEVISCAPGCEGLFRSKLETYNATVSANGGQFGSVSPVGVEAFWVSGGQRQLVHLALTPQTIVVWTRSAPAKRTLADGEYSERIRAVINRQRYSEALPQGNVMIGRWAEQIHQHARDLLAQGHKDEAIAALGQLVAWAPNLYEAQLDFAGNTPDHNAARTSAMAVWDNAERPELTARAGRLLGRDVPTAAALSVLPGGLRGLQVVLIPLAPCDIRLAEDAAKIYEANLQVPVRIARLPVPWNWDAPDRLYGQRFVQGLLIKKAGKPIDFTGWTRERYAAEMTRSFAKDDALTRFGVRSFIDGWADKPGQYRVDDYVERLLNILAPLRSDDRRTMYVGVTEADIYMGEFNFVYSSSGAQQRGGASILSYARMQGVANNERYHSRQRLADRLAKELVPATLKQVGIPRPTDPTDPYSYSDGGIDRFAQKTMTLSAPTREALDRIRVP
jgi:hypothetical protein